jgi:hypothetical protein
MKTISIKAHLTGLIINLVVLLSISTLSALAQGSSPDLNPVVVGTPQIGEEYWVEVRIGTSVSITDLYGLSFKLRANSTSTLYVDDSAERGAFLGSSVIQFFRKVDDQTVDIAVTKTSPPGNSGSGLFARAKFRTTAAGSVTFSLVDVSGFNSQGTELTFDAKTASVTFGSTQNNPTPQLSSINPNSGALGQSVSVSLTGNGFVQGVTSVSFGSGITVGSLSVSSATSAVAQIQISSSTSAGTRDVSITNPAPGGGTATLAGAFTVNSPPPSPVLNVSPSAISKTSAGGTESISISNTGGGTLSWTASSNQSWATLNSSSGSGNASIVLSIAENTSSSSRSATLTVSATGASNSPQTISVTQTGVSSSNPPDVSTSSVTNVGLTSATVTGAVNNQGSSSVTNRGVCYGTSPSPTISGSCVSSGSGTGSFSASITGLNTGTLYYVRAFATNSAGTGYGSNLSFTTETQGTPPTVSTSSATNVSTTSATLGGNVTDQGSSSVNERGVCYSSSNSEPGLNDSCINASSTGLGSYSITVSNLSQNTSYSARAFATNSTGTAFGATVTFTTQGSGNPIPGLVSIEPNAARLNSTVDVTLIGTNFVNGITIQAGNGIQVSNVSVLSSTSLTARFTISSSATVGARSITVTNPSPGGGASAGNLSFSVTLPPPNPNSTNWPVGTVVPTSSQPTFDWSPVSGATNYTVQVSNQSGFPQKEACIACYESVQNTFTNTYAVIATSFKVPTALATGTTYYWRLRANTSTTQGVWSNSFAFTVVNPPSSPLLVFPDNGATGLTGSVQLVWTPTANTKRYELQVSRDVNFANLIQTTDTLTISTFRMPAFTAGSPVDYFWRVRSVGDGGNSSWTDVRFYRRAALTSDGPESSTLPTQFEMLPNYPNPFNPSTQIQYSLPTNGTVEMRLYSITGHLIRTLLSEYKNAGTHQYLLDASGLTSGVYVVSLYSQGEMRSIRLTLLK